MDVIQLLITIVVVTILVTIVLAVVTYVAYKLRLAREPSALERPVDGPRYFVRYDPPAPEPEPEPVLDESDAEESGGGESDVEESDVEPAATASEPEHHAS